MAQRGRAVVKLVSEALPAKGLHYPAADIVAVVFAVRRPSARLTEPGREAALRQDAGKVTEFIIRREVGAAVDAVKQQHMHAVCRLRIEAAQFDLPGTEAARQDSCLVFEFIRHYLFIIQVIPLETE